MFFTQSNQSNRINQSNQSIAVAHPGARHGDVLSRILVLVTVTVAHQVLVTVTKRLPDTSMLPDTNMLPDDII